MQVKVKNSKGVMHSIAVEATNKVSELKTKVCEAFENTDVQNIKLIFRGKLLVDENTLESYEIKEDSQIVMMISKTPTDTKTQDEKDLNTNRAVDNC
jgi:Ubiquitin family